MLEDTWQSPVVAFAFGATELVPSWNLAGVGDREVRVALQVCLDESRPDDNARDDHAAWPDSGPRTDRGGQAEHSSSTCSGTWTDWIEMARWNETPADPTAPQRTRRTSIPQKSEAEQGTGSTVRAETDTLVAPPGHRIMAARMRIEIAPGADPAAPGSDTPAPAEPGSAANAAPVMLHLVTLMGSADLDADHAADTDTDTPVDSTAIPDKPAVGRNAVAADAARTVGTAPDQIPEPVPAHSQMLHRDTFRSVGGGGDSWCSPTTVVMLQEHWIGAVTDRSLKEATSPESAEHPVPWAALRTYDAAYQGTGNWSFNVAHAGRRAADGRGLEAFVTRLRSLDEAQRLTDAGFPLGASVSFTRAQLPEAGYQTAGHLLVITGFTGDGDVQVNDPAAPNDAEVRRVYPRERFDQAWLRSGRTVYLVHPPEVPLPPSRSDEPNW